MKRSLILNVLLFLVCLILFSLSAKTQNTLYNRGGISLNYYCTVVKTFYCDKEKKDVYYLKLSWALSNNSGKSAQITYGFAIQPNEVLWCTPIGVYDEVTATLNQPFGTGFGSPVVLKTSDQTFGGYYIWSFSRDYLPGWNIGPIYFANNSTTTVNNNNTYPKSQSAQSPKQQTQSKKPGISIYQNDNVVNPKTTIDYAQKQKQDDIANDNAMKSWRAADSARNDELRRLNSIPNKYKAPANSQQQQEEIRRRQQQIAAQQQEKLNQIQQQQQRQQQLQQDLNNAQSASTSAFDNAINSGKKTSGAIVDATLAGAQNISDPKASLAYTGVGLGVAIFAALGERKEAKMQARQEELKEIKASLSSNETVFDFMSGSTDYHITRLKVEMKKNGRIKNVIRTDLYDVSVNIHRIVNSADKIEIFESVSFKNRTTAEDSSVISKIVIPINQISSISAYNGNYTNSFDYSSNSYDNYRYKELSNGAIADALSMGYSTLPSGLTDVYIETKSSSIQIQKKYVKKAPYLLTDNDFNDVYSYSSTEYLLVFDEYNSRIKDFVDYLNFIKN